MAGETTATSPAPRWACPTVVLDLGDIKWTAYEVEPGTCYEDEPSEMIPPGWYLHGRPRDEDDPRDYSPYILRIDQASDEHGCDTSARLAWRLAEMLNQASAPPTAALASPKPSHLRRFANGCGDVIGALIREVR